MLCTRMSVTSACACQSGRLATQDLCTPKTVKGRPGTQQGIDAGHTRRQAERGDESDRIEARIDILRKVRRHASAHSRFGRTTHSRDVFQNASARRGETHLLEVLRRVVRPLFREEGPCTPRGCRPAYSAMGITRKNPRHVQTRGTSRHARKELISGQLLHSPVRYSNTCRRLDAASKTLSFRGFLSSSMFPRASADICKKK